MDATLLDGIIAFLNSPVSTNNPNITWGGFGIFIVILIFIAIWLGDR